MEPIDSNPRPLVAVAAVALVFIAQSAIAVWLGGVGPFALWSSTLLLLMPAIAWLLMSDTRASIIATGVMALFIAAANVLGPFGYIAAFWVGLPVCVVVAWLDGRRRPATVS